MKRPTSDWIAILLAGGLSLAVVILVLGVVIAAIQHGNTASSLSENESQVLTAAFGGMIGVLGAWVGYRAHADGRGEVEDGWPEDTAELPPR